MIKERPKVAIIYKSMPQYRRQFFNLLKKRLDVLGIDLLLIYGQAGNKDASKKDEVEIPWATKIENKILKFGRIEVYWQPCLSLLSDVDMVIVEQASKLLINYVMLFQHLLGKRKMAFWGHGKNFQSRGKKYLAETIKRIVSRKVHWWFAYNSLSASVIESLGFPTNRITLVQNAIDTRKLIEVKDQTGLEDLELLKNALDIKGSNIGIFCGGMYEEKCLDFLFDASLLIKDIIKDFELILIGGGPEAYKAQEKAAIYPWIHYIGPRFDDEKVPYFLVSKVYLMPGLVGLGILDSFALEIPLITTNISFHSPEIEYLDQNSNGLMVKHDVNQYSSAVVNVLLDNKLRSRLIQGCRTSRLKYSIETMVENFAIGVVNALEAE